MRIIACCACVSLVLSACEGWPLATNPYNPPTLVPSRTPSIQTATSIILSPMPMTATVPASTETAMPPKATPTLVEVTPSETLEPAPTPDGTLQAEILGCDTSIDILHGMGEVTNAYVQISNTTAADVPNVCATLRALDEGRPHPDKTKCIPSLPAGYRVAFKLTVDSTYQEQTPVQVDVTSGGTLLHRTGQAACTAIGILPPDVDSLGTPGPAR